MFDRLMKKAGFIFWQSDEMGKGVDWSCDYTKEMKLYNRYLLDEVCVVVEAARKRGIPPEKYGNIIKQYFSY